MANEKMVNQLYSDIVDKLIPLICKNKENILYIKNASDKFMRTMHLKEINMGLMINDKKLPFIILYIKEDNTAIFIESCNSQKFFSPDKVNNIKSACKSNRNIKLAFINAFLTTEDMLDNFANIAWETDIWCADEPDHFLHKL